MPAIFPGRHTALTHEPFAFFLIGMRVNRLLAVRKWWPVISAMRPMLRELAADPARGFLGAQPFIYWRGVGLLQYWRSFEHLETYARDPGGRHLAAWRAFNKAVGGDGSVGIWHETYAVEAGRFEAVYNNMPRFGLAAATRHAPFGGGHETARERLRGRKAV
jgi:hypothetical protein